jgi:hypothetical protein
MAETGSGIVEAREAFSVDLPTGTCVVHAHDRFYSDDPVVRGREHLFGLVTVRRSVPDPVTATETATAAPGERRAAPLGRKGASGGAAAGKDVTRA